MNTKSSTPTATLAPMTIMFTLALWYIARITTSSINHHRSCHEASQVHLVDIHVDIAGNQRHFISQDESRHDTGFVPLTPEQRALLDGVRFITSGDMATFERGPHRHYIVGYRADDNEPIGVAGMVEARWSAYAAMSAGRETYQQLRLLDADCLLLTFNRRSLFDAEGPVDPEPEPQGMSGAGVWCHAANPADDKLVAILDSHSEPEIFASGTTTLLASLEAYADGRLR
jgi:hypothetical protein